MGYNFIYTQEYQRPLRAVLVDIRYNEPYPTVNDNELFYKIEYYDGSLAGVLILTVDNTNKSCINKFKKLRRPFLFDLANVNLLVNNFITSNNWQQNFLFT